MYFNINRDRFSIKVGIFGAVSVGKTTFLNALFAEILSESKRKKCTLLPQVYQEVDMSDKNQIKNIRKTNKSKNKEILEILEKNSNNFNLDICRPIFYDVEKIYRFFSKKLDSFYLDIYDLPGLDDGASKDIFFQWVNMNFDLFDIVIFMTDIDKAFNQNGEVEILKLIFDNIKKRNDKTIFFIPLLNKCDNLDEEGNLTTGSENGNNNDDDSEEESVNEDKEMYDQANLVLLKTSKEYGLEEKIETKFIPFSAENALIYRLLAKNPDEKLDKKLLNTLGTNEYGHNGWRKMSKIEKANALAEIIDSLKKNKDYNERMKPTGFISFKNKMEDIIAKNKYTFLKNQTINECANIININNFNDFKEYAKVLIEKSNLMRDIFNASNNDILFKKFNEYLFAHYNKIYKDEKINQKNLSYDALNDILNSLITLNNELDSFCDLILEYYDDSILENDFNAFLKICSENRNKISELSKNVLLEYNIDFNTFHKYNDILKLFYNIMKGTPSMFSTVAKNFVLRLRYDLNKTNFRNFMNYNDNVKIISFIKQNSDMGEMLIDLLLDKLALINDTQPPYYDRKDMHVYLVRFKYYLKQKYNGAINNKIIQIKETIKYLLNTYPYNAGLMRDKEINYLDFNIDFEKNILD